MAKECHKNGGTHQQEIIPAPQKSRVEASRFAARRAKRGIQGFSPPRRRRCSRQITHAAPTPQRQYYWPRVSRTRRKTAVEIDNSRFQTALIATAHAWADAAIARASPSARVGGIAKCETGDPRGSPASSPRVQRPRQRCERRSRQPPYCARHDPGLRLHKASLTTPLPRTIG